MLYLVTIRAGLKPIESALLDLKCTRFNSDQLAGPAAAFSFYIPRKQSLLFRLLAACCLHLRHDIYNTVAALVI